MLKSGTWEKPSQKDASKTRPRMQKPFWEAPETIKEEIGN